MDSSPTTSADSGFQNQGNKANSKTNTKRSFFRAVFPHIALVQIVCFYLIVGGLIFREIEISAAKNMANTAPIGKSDGKTAFHEAQELTVKNSILFCFVTITTIGYGNVAPKSVGGRIFCMFYSMIGIALFGLCMADLGKFFTKLCWRALFSMQKLGVWKRKDCYGVQTDKPPPAGQPIPWWLILSLFIIYLMIGACIFPLYEKLGIFESLYFTFISLTTIGYGDYSPGNLNFMIFTMIYLSCGLGLNLIAIQVLGEILQKLHHVGEDKVENALDARVWFGGRQMVLQDLMDAVAKNSNMSAAEQEKLVGNLDNIVQKKIDDKVEEGRTGKSKPQPTELEVDFYVKTNGVVDQHSTTITRTSSTSSVSF